MITVSDSGSAGQRHDISGPTAANRLREAGFECDDPIVVSDDVHEIATALRSAVADGIELIVTTGGTGLAERDVTPEATEMVITKVVPGLAELMRAEGAKHTPLAALSRAVTGVAGKSLVVNLPGSPKGVEESLDAAIEVIPHALDVISGPAGH